MEPVSVTGTIRFDPENMTKKHDKHASWKRVAMLMINCDISDYYAWFIKKRFNISLPSPQRGAHITFINDRMSDMNGRWEEVKNKWNGKQLSVDINTDIRTDSEYWWLNLLPNDTLTLIRSELGLGDPFYKFHLTIGRAVNCRSNEPNENGSMRAMEMHEEQSQYIHRLIQKGLIS